MKWLWIIFAFISSFAFSNEAKDLLGFEESLIAIYQNPSHEIDFLSKNINQKEIKGFYKQFYFQRFTISFMLTKKAFDF